MKKIYLPLLFGVGVGIGIIIFKATHKKKYISIPVRR